jgi:hypothetical protein
VIAGVPGGVDIDMGRLQRIHRIADAGLAQLPCAISQRATTGSARAAMPRDFYKQAGLEIGLGVFLAVLAAAETALSQLPISCSPIDTELVCDWIASRLHESTLAQA